MKYLSSAADLKAIRLNDSLCDLLPKLSRLPREAWTFSLTGNENKRKLSMNPKLVSPDVKPLVAPVIQASVLPAGKPLAAPPQLPKLRAGQKIGMREGAFGVAATSLITG